LGRGRREKRNDRGFPQVEKSSSLIAFLSLSGNLHRRIIITIGVRYGSLVQIVQCPHWFARAFYQLVLDINGGLKEGGLVLRNPSVAVGRYDADRLVSGAQDVGNLAALACGLKWSIMARHRLDRGDDLFVTDFLARAGEGCVASIHEDRQVVLGIAAQGVDQFCSLVGCHGTKVHEDSPFMTLRFNQGPHFADGKSRLFHQTRQDLRNRAIRLGVVRGQGDECTASRLAK
jgi:hypothetical protein